MLRNDSEEFEVSGLRSVLQAMAVAFRAIEAVALDYFFADAFFSRSLLNGDSLTLGDENHLTAVFVSMKADRGTRCESASEYSIGSVKEHIGLEFFFTALEGRKDAEVYFVKFDDHDIFFSKLQIFSNILSSP